MASLSSVPRLSFVDSNGNALVAGKLWTYESGTSTPLATYGSADQVTVNTNPVILDSRGEALVYLATGANYRFYLTTSTDVPVWAAPVDNITSATNTEDIGYDANLTGSVIIDLNDKLNERVSVLSFGAVGDGVTDDYAALQAAFNCGKKNIFVPDGTYITSALLTVPTNVTVEGSSPSAARIQLATGAANNTNVISLGQYSVLRNIWIRGNWDGSTAGQLGIGIYAKDVSAGFMHGLNLENVAVDRCKSTGVYIYEGAYCRAHNLVSDTHGLDAMHLEGASPASFTTFELSGESILSSCPNGYGLRIKNGLNSRFNFISEFTLGVAFEGDHRCLMFDTCYFETSAGGQNYIYNVLSGGAFGITIQNNFLGMTPAVAVIQGDANHFNGLLINNSNLTTKPYLATQWGNWTIIDTGKVVRARGTSCVLDAQYVTVGNVGVGEDTLFTYTLPGGTLYRDGTAIRLRAWGKTAANANTKNLKVYFGSTAVYTSGAVVANDRDWVIDTTVVRAGASDQRFSVTGVYNSAAVVNCSTTTQTLASDVIIKVTGEATSNNDISQQGWTIELLDLQSLTF